MFDIIANSWLVVLDLQDVVGYMESTEVISSLNLVRILSNILYYSLGWLPVFFTKCMAIVSHVRSLGCCLFFYLDHWALTRVAR